MPLCHLTLAQSCHLRPECKLHHQAGTEFNSFGTVRLALVLDRDIQLAPSIALAMLIHSRIQNPALNRISGDELPHFPSNSGRFCSRRNVLEGEGGHCLFFPVALRFALSLVPSFPRYFVVALALLLYFFFHFFLSA